MGDFSCYFTRLAYFLGQIKSTMSLVRMMSNKIMELSTFYLMEIQNSNYDDALSFFMINLMDVCFHFL